MDHELDINRFVPPGKVLARIKQALDSSCIRMPGHELTEEELDGGILLEYSEQGNVVKIPPGYGLVRIMPHGANLWTPQEFLDLHDLFNWMIVPLHERQSFVSSLENGNISQARG